MAVNHVGHVVVAQIEITAIQPTEILAFVFDGSVGIKGNRESCLCAVLECICLTFDLEEEAADPSQKREGDEVPEAGSNWGGHVVRVDANLP